MHLKRPKLRLAIGGAILLLLLAALVLVWFDRTYNSFEARFERSRPALKAYAATVMASPPTGSFYPPPKIGSFEASDGIPLPHGFAFRADYGHFLDWEGLAYSTEALPKQLPDPSASTDDFDAMYFEHLEGNWYKVFRN